MAKRLLLVFTLFIFSMSGLVASDFAMQTKKSDDPVTKILNDGFELISHYWQIVDYRYKFEAGEIGNNKRGIEESEFVEAYLKVLDKYNWVVKRATKRLVKKFNIEDPVFISFSEFYKSQPAFLKEALDPVVKGLVANYQQLSPTSDTKTFLREYFPGYGYGDPKYKYRKGKEVDREFLYARWLEESRTISQSKVVELVVEVSLVAGLQEKYPDARVIGKAFPINIGGKIVMAVKVTWNNSTQITTRTKKKIGHYKIWFELWRAKKTWGSAEWELTGKTYELLEEATGEEVTVSMKFE